MNGNNGHIKNYSAEDIQKYLLGELSAAEMHALEKAAMDDPLLSDALEGMQKTFLHKGRDLFEADLNELKQKIKERVSGKKKTIAMQLKRTWWRAIAAVIILGGAGSLLFHYLLPFSKPVQNISDIQPKSIPPSNSIIKPPSPAVKKALEPPIIKSRSMAKAETITENKKSRPSSQMPEKLGLSGAGQTASNPDKNSLRNLKKNIPDSIILHKTNNNGFEDKVAGVTIERSNSNYFKGKVVDANQQPLVGASIQVINDKTSTLTDNNGLFSLNTSRQDSVMEVKVTTAGFQPVSAAINDITSNIIQLNPAHNNLDETALAYAAKKKDAGSRLGIEPGSAFHQSSPAGGWAAYEKYLDKNKKIATLDSLLKGDEILSFIIDKKGDISSFSFQKSLSPAHDAEAMRLVRQGPRWIYSKKRKSKGTLRISF